MKLLGKLHTKPSIEIRDSHVSIGFECLDRDVFDPERCYDLLGQSGVKYARVQTGWAKTEQQKGVYNFAWLDRIVDQLLVRGIQPWFNVGFGNPIYMPDVPNTTGVGCVPLLYGEETYRAWLNFACALAEHYKSRVTHYEIWNESDIVHFWYPSKPSGAEYAQLIRDTGAAIHTAFPAAKIGACTSSGSESGYLEELYRHLQPGELDFYCVHNYDRDLEYGDRSRSYGAVRELLKKNGHTQTEIWMGEGGYASWHPVGHFQCAEGGQSEHQQAVWMLRRYFLDLKLGTRLSSFFQMVDMWQKPYEKAQEVLKKPAAQGILNGITYTPKLAYYTIGRLSTVLGGACVCNQRRFMVSVPVSNNDPVPVQLSYSLDGREIYVYWLPYPIVAENGLCQTCAITLDAQTAITHPVLIDLLENRVYELAQSDLNSLPIGEYPLLIADRDTFALEPCSNQMI